jgi:hypothetical protein
MSSDEFSHTRREVYLHAAAAADELGCDIFFHPRPAKLAVQRWILI